MRKPSKKVLKELEDIRLSHPAGLLLAEDVVARAKNKTNVLYKYFEWDNDKAAYEYRLDQARRLIRVSVQIIDVHMPETRVYVSLRDDRKSPKGGYRAMVEVLKDPTLREKMLMEALLELDVIKQKYEQLQELASVFMAIDKTRERFTKKLKREKVAV